MVRQGTAASHGGLGVGFRPGPEYYLEGGGLAAAAGTPTGILEAGVHHGGGGGSWSTNLSGWVH